MDASIIGIILYVFGLTILVSIFSVGVATNAKLAPKDFGLQVTLPNIIGLLLFFIGSVIVFKGASDQFFVTIILITAVGGIYVSILSIMNSLAVMRGQGS